MEEMLFLCTSDRLELYPFHQSVMQVEYAFRPMLAIAATAEGLSHCTIPPWTPALLHEKLC